jgi:hypothetical protein
MFSGLLPIGSVVLLKESTKRVMIAGIIQRSASDPNKIYDYCGVVFPEGYLSSETLLLFNNEQIDQIYALGYQDAEQIRFKAQADEAVLRIRNGEA